MFIDDLAYKSRFKDINPMEKFFLSFFNLVTTTIWDDFILSLLIFFSMTYLIIKSTGDIRAYFKLLYYPSIFILMTIVTLLWTGTNSFYIINLVTKSYSLIISVNFLFVTTTIVDITYIMKRLKLPSFFIELFILIYRYIFYIFDIRDNIKNSQLSKLAYGTYKKSIKDFAILIKTVFTRSFLKVEHMKYSLLARNYNGTVNYLHRKKVRSNKNYVYLLSWIIITNLIGVYL